MKNIENKLVELIDKIPEMDKTEKFIEAKVIKTNTIVIGDWVLFKCQHGCGHYNTSLGCPPFTPKPEEMVKIADNYEYGILIQCKNSLKTPSHISVELEKLAIGMEFYKAIGLGAGPCQFCEECNLNSCINRDKARPSMESCGIDVQQTVMNNDYEMVKKQDNGDIFYCYGLVLVI